MPLTTSSLVPTSSLSLSLGAACGMCLCQVTQTAPPAAVPARPGAAIGGLLSPEGDAIRQWAAAESSLGRLLYSPGPGNTAGTRSVGIEPHCQSAEGQTVC